MPTLIFYKCVDCKKRLETQDAYYSIGEPFIKCEYCHTYNLISGNRTEWELKSPLGRALHWGKIALVSGMVGGGFGVLAAEGLKHFGYNMDGIYSGLVVAGLALAFWFFQHQLQGDISESHERMSDPQYRALLQRMKLLR